MAGKYEIKEDFFSRRYTEYNAYVLGYLYASGSVYRGRNNKRYELTISGTDSELLKQINKVMRSTYPVQSINGTYQIRVSNKKIVKRLEKLGLGPDKTNTLRFPDYLPKKLERHFIRGFFDGKGTYMKEEGRRIVINFSCGSYRFLEELRDRLVLMGVTAAQIHRYGAERATNVIRYYVRDTRRLYRIMYYRAGIYSRTKRAKYDRGV